jgi:hypothetical protein
MESPRHKIHSIRPRPYHPVALLLTEEQDFWRMTAFASIACQMFIRRYGLRRELALSLILTVDSHPGVLSSPHADLTRRLFWHISIMET